MFYLVEVSKVRVEEVLISFNYHQRSIKKKRLFSVRGKGEGRKTPPPAEKSRLTALKLSIEKSNKGLID